MGRSELPASGFQLPASSFWLLAFRLPVRRLPLEEPVAGSCELEAGSWKLEAGSWKLLYGFFPGNHSGLNLEFASHRTGDSIERIESVMCAKSIVFTSSDGW